MKLEVEVPEEEMRRALADIVSRLFARADYSSKGGDGYRALAAQVDGWLLKQDFGALIQAEAARQLSGVVAEVVRARLQVEVKRQAVEMAKQMRLLPEDDDDEPA